MSAGLVVDWLGRAAPAAAFVYRTNSLVNQLIAARVGIGIALLPCYLGDGQPKLARAFADSISDLEGELWIVTHADLKGTTRVRAFFDIVGEGLARERDVFAGAGDRRGANWPQRSPSLKSKDASLPSRPECR